MNEISSLAQGGAVGIALALIILIGYAIKVITPIASKFSESLDANTKATTEMHEFLKSLNGRLKKVVDDKLNNRRQG